MKPHLVPSLSSEPFVFLSGQLPFGAGGVIAGDGIAEQTRLTLSNMSTVLADAGLSLTDVVKTTVWITKAEDFAAFDTAYAAAFGDHRPTRSTVVSGLVAPGALVEIEAVARVSNGSSVP